MADKIRNYKCPSCSAPLSFDAASGRLKCDHCGSEYDPNYIEELFEKGSEGAGSGQGSEVAGSDASTGAVNTEASSRIVADWESSDLSEGWGSDANKVIAYNCPSCGAELILDQTTAATSCPYCGNNTIVPGQLSGAYKPDYIIPFKCAKNEAEGKLKDYYRGKFFLPASFRDDSHIKEIKGIYVPFWLFDGTADASIEAECSNTRILEQFDRTVTETDHYHVSRSGTIEFHKIPVDASSRMPDDYMDSLEPFNYDDLKDFSASYLPGFIADKYDVEFKDCEERVNNRCTNTAVSSLSSTISGYESVNVCSYDVNITKGKVSYALLPVWLLNSNWQGKNYKFAVNGQTGKVVGNLPKDKVRVAGCWGAISVLLVALYAVFMLWVDGGYQYHARSVAQILNDYYIVYIVPIMMMVSGTITFALTRGMKNVASGLRAGTYVSAEGLSLTARGDAYTHTTRSVVMKTNAGGRSGGGGFSAGGGMGRPGGMSRPGGMRR